jgi:hypothetical protein
VTGVTTMRIGVSLCCAKAGARPAANEKAAAPATKVLRVWLIVRSCHSRKISVLRPRFSAAALRPTFTMFRLPAQRSTPARVQPSFGATSAEARTLCRLSWADDVWKAAVFIWKQHYRQFATCKGNQPGAWRPNVPGRLKSLTEEPHTVASTRFNRPTKDMLDPSLRNLGATAFAVALRRALAANMLPTPRDARELGFGAR